MADKLAIWKQALIHLGKATIATLTDDVEAVNVFGNAWDGVVEEAFASGDWNFAKESQALTQSVTGTAATGYDYVFDYPSDYVRALAVSDYAGFANPFYDYVDEGGFLSANTSTIYLRFISDTKAADPTTWPTMFWRYVALLLATETCEKLTNSSTAREALEKRTEKALRKAKSVDARNENNKRLGTGSWMRARLGVNTGDGSRGGTLVGGEITLQEGDI
jgi:hypothetical protein